jgi:hypothetical protein
MGIPQQAFLTFACKAKAPLPLLYLPRYTFRQISFNHFLISQCLCYSPILNSFHPAMAYWQDAAAGKQLRVHRRAKSLPWHKGARVAFGLPEISEVLAGKI